MTSIYTAALNYREGATELCGFLAHDREQPTALPAVLIAPEAAGITEHSQRRAQMLAELGYVALVIDMFGDGELRMGPDAMQRVERLRSVPGLLRKRVIAGLQALAALPGVNPAELAAIGYCFGGLCALELARAGASIAGVASFHGLLDPPSEPSQLQAKVLVCTGADDPLVPASQVVALQEELRLAKVDWQVITYGGAQHAFTNRDADQRNIPGLRHHAAADRRSWQVLQVFLQELF